jgi:hypothetical protein
MCKYTVCGKWYIIATSVLERGKQTRKSNSVIPVNLILLHVSLRTTPRDEWGQAVASQSLGDFFVRHFTTKSRSQMIHGRKSRDNTVGIAAGYGLVGRGSIHGRGKNFVLSITSRPSVGPTQPPTGWVPGALSLGVKRQKRESDHSPPPSAEVKNGVVLN